MAGRPARPKWIVPLLLALLLLAGLAMLLSRCGSDDDKEPVATPAVTQPAAAPNTAASASGRPGAGQGNPVGTVTAENVNLLGAATSAGLREHDGEQAVARAARVQSVPADEGFWVGADETERLWVQLTGTRGESDYKVKEGDHVDFTGTLTAAAANFAADAGVTGEEGADQLTGQGYYVSVPASNVRLSE